jgi:K+-transporting ATPase ATPase C chain
MTNYLKPAAILLLLLTLVTGVIYPALVTALAQLFFTEQARAIIF